MRPEHIPTEIEDEILEAFTTYSFDDDMRIEHLGSYYKDLKIPSVFLAGNSRIVPSELTIEGTDIIDFDKLLIKSFQLIVIRNNKQIIQQNWDLLQAAYSESSDISAPSSGLNLKNLKDISDGVKSGISDPLLLDMVAVATEGEGVSVTFIDFAYILGKIGELLIER